MTTSKALLLCLFGALSSTDAFLNSSPLHLAPISRSLAPAAPSCSAVRAPSLNLFYPARSTTSLAAAAAEEEEEEALPLVVPEIVLDEGEDFVRAREAQVSFYNSAVWMYGATTLDVISLASKSGAGPPLVANVPAAASLLATVAFVTLKSAASSSRLSSDTYKRLNLSILLYSALTASAGLASSSTPNPAKLSGVAVHIYGAFICAAGWLKGARGLNAPASSAGAEARGMALGELRSGAGQTFSILSSALKRPQALPYFCASLASGLMALHDAFLLLYLGNYGLLTGAKLTKRLYSLANSLLLAGASVTLSDAALRDRMSGTTFVYLNAASSLVGAAVGLAAVVGKGAVGGRGAVQAGLGAVVAAVAANNARKHWK